MAFLRKLFQIKSVRPFSNLANISKFISNANDDEFKDKMSSVNANWEDEKILLSPLIHVSKSYDATGVNVLRSMMLSFNHWCHVPEKEVQLIEDISQLFRNGYTLLDDVEDNTTVRRSVSTANAIYDIPLTINAGFYALLVALEKSLVIPQPDAAIKLVLNMLFKIQRARKLEFYWTLYGHCPTEEEVLNNNKQEIFPFLYVGVKLLQLCSNNLNDYSKLTQYLAQYYALRNDYMDLWSDEYKELKNIAVCEDISLGKFTLPIVYGIRNSKRGKDILLILNKHTTDTAMQKYCLSLIEECGTKEYIIDKLREIREEILAEIHKHGGNSQLRNVVDEKLQLRETKLVE